MSHFLTSIPSTTFTPTSLPLTLRTLLTLLSIYLLPILLTLLLLVFITPLLHFRSLRNNTHKSNITHTSTYYPNTIATPAPSQSLLASARFYLPLELVARPSDYRIVTDTVSRSVRWDEMPDLKRDEMVRVYLRRTMGLFGSLPQGWGLWVVGRGERGTFGREWVEGLRWEGGDVVCGVYRVRSSNGGKGEGKGGSEGVVCFGFGGRERGERWEGRLVVSVGEGGEVKGRGGGMVVFKAETWMWVKKGDGRMPLEGWLMRWVHEMTSWWLMWKGTEYMKELGEKDKKVF